MLELIIEQQETMNRFYSHRNDKEIFLNNLISDQMTILSASKYKHGRPLIFYAMIRGWRCQAHLT